MTKRGDQPACAHSDRNAHVHYPEATFVVERPTLYLVRNALIAQEGDWLLAAPKEETMQRRSGTWTTVRSALRMGRQIFLVMPDGTIDRWRD